jgi:hypothetical protein
VTVAQRGALTYQSAMTPEQLTGYGRLLYGAEWQTPLAEALGVADRTVRRWVGGDSPIPAGIPAELLELLEAHRAKLEAAIARLAKSV